MTLNDSGNIKANDKTQTVEWAKDRNVEMGKRSEEVKPEKTQDYRENK